MSKLKITQGEWVTDPSIESNGMIKTEFAYTIMQADLEEMHIAAVWKDGLGNPNHNAKLICDAGTTYNQCGLLPSELLQQNEELKDVLNLFMESSGILSWKQRKAREILTKYNNQTS